VYTPDKSEVINRFVYARVLRINLSRLINFQLDVGLRYLCSFYSTSFVIDHSHCITYLINCLTVPMQPASF
jgi:hypothetical protein